MSKLTKKDVTDIKDSITHSGEFRVHLIYSRTGLTTKCRMWHPDGHVVGSASGGGYDKAGAAIGQAIELFFAEELKGLKPGTEYLTVGGKQEVKQNVGGLYGLSRFSDGTVSLDGACGLVCMLKILVALGYEPSRYETGKLSTMIVARRERQ